MGFDFGMARTGVAVGQRLTATATALTVLETPFRKGWEPLLALLEEWAPAELVVGYPRQMDGSDSEVAQAATRFANRLAERSGLPVHRVDERLTSKAAEAQFRQLRRQGAARKHQAGKLDAHAARLILETWLMSSPQP